MNINKFSFDFLAETFFDIIIVIRHPPKKSEEKKTNPRHKIMGEFLCKIPLSSICIITIIRMRERGKKKKKLEMLSTKNDINFAKSFNNDGVK